MYVWKLSSEENVVLPIVNTVSKVKSGGQRVGHWRQTAQPGVQIVGDFT
jgi:hypothetical protein